MRIAMLCLLLTPAAVAQSPFASAVLEYSPAPGQFVNDPLYVDTAKALGAPLGDNPSTPSNDSLVSLGGFGGSLTLAFDHTVMDDPANPFGLDAIVYGNALWVTGDPQRRWAEGGTIEISRDANGNGVADDAWYVIPGSHLDDPSGAWHVQTWDDDIFDATWPPDDDTWLPPGTSGMWTTAGWHLPGDVFEQMIVSNPLGPAAREEGIWGYADYTPTQGLPAGGVADAFYTRPDDPLHVGLTPGSGGGDGFDIAWAVDPTSGVPAGLDGFDYIRITTAVHKVFIDPPFGEMSTEVDAAADVAAGHLGDVENDGDIDLDDFAVLVSCAFGAGQAAPSCPCRVMDFDQDHDVDLADAAAFQAAFGTVWSGT
jgi:hypothetical protein